MNQSTYNSLKSFIWGIANDCLVDVYDVGDYRKIILPMFVIRRFDAVLEPKHEAVMKVKEQFTKAGITELDAALASASLFFFCDWFCLYFSSNLLYSLFKSPSVLALVLIGKLTNINNANKPVTILLFIFFIIFLSTFLQLYYYQSYQQ